MRSVLVAASKHLGWLGIASAVACGGTNDTTPSQGMGTRPASTPVAAAPPSTEEARRSGQGAPSRDVFGVAAIRSECPPGTLVIPGTSAGDVLVGTAEDDCILGGDGDDTIDGGGGRDFLVGGAGDDVIRGGAGDDAIYGSNGNDLLIGEAGNDKLDGGDGNDDLAGGPGDDILDGGPGADRLAGGPGANILTGGGGNDLLVGTRPADVVRESAGSDMLVPEPASDLAKYGPRFDPRPPEHCLTEKCEDPTAALRALRARRRARMHGQPRRERFGAGAPAGRSRRKGTRRRWSTPRSTRSGLPLGELGY